MENKSEELQDYHQKLNIFAYAEVSSDISDAHAIRSSFQLLSWNSNMSYLWSLRQTLYKVIQLASNTCIKVTGSSRLASFSRNITVIRKSKCRESWYDWKYDDMLFNSWSLLKFQSSIL